jgi:HK97 family phage major capsid protein
MTARTLASTTTDVEDIVIPDSPAALEEFMADRKNMLAVLQQNKFEDLVRSYADIVLKKNLDIKRQVDEQVQAGLANYLRDASEEHGIVPVNLDAAKAMGRGLAAPGAGQLDAKHGLYSPQALGAKLDREFQGPNAASQFFNLIWKNYKRNLDTEGVAKMKRIRDAFQSDVPSDGGFLIPENLRSEMLRVALESSIVRGRARVIPMETLRVPFPMIDSTSNTSSVFGGIVCYWTEESGTLQDSSPQFGRIVLEAKKLTAYTQVPQELVADSVISFQPFISQIFPEALSFYEDLAFLKGTGVGEPTGMLNANKNLATIVSSKEAGQTAGTIVWENLIKMFARMLPSSMGRGVWIASIDTLPELATMALSVGTGGSAVWMNNGAQGPPVTILGRPVIFTEKAPGAVGTQGDISFVDPSFYLIGDRQVMSSSVSEHYRFGNDELAFKIIERVDGRPWLQSPITPQNAGATLSPFVQLETR